MYKRAPLEARLYLRGAVWWFWGYDYAGKRYRHSTHQTDRKSALEAARDEERRRAAAPDPAAAKPEAIALTLADVLRLLREEDLRNNARPNTLTFHRDRGRHLLRVLGQGYLVHSLELADTNRYTDVRLAEGDRTIKERHTIQKEIRTLTQALRVAKENGLYAGDPKALTPKAFRKQSKFYKPGNTWLAKPEYCQALIDETSTGGPQKARVNAERKLDIAAYIHSGVRQQELWLINPEHVHLAKRYIEVDGTKTDGAKRNVAMSDTLHEIFARKMKGAKRGRPLFEPWHKVDRDLKANWLRARARLLAAAADVDTREALDHELPQSLCCNDLRRTFCSLMAAAGVPLHHCADLMGHKSLTMIMEVYRQVSPASLHAAVATLPAFALPVIELRPAATAMSRRERQRLWPGRAGRPKKSNHGTTRPGSL